MGGAGARMYPPGRRQAVDHQINRPRVALQHFDGLPLELIRKRIAVQVGREQAGFPGRPGEGDRVVPARSGWPPLLGRPLVEDPHGRRSRAERRGDARGQPIAGRGAYHQDPLGPVGDGPLGFHVGDPLAHVGGAALRMGGDADEAPNLGFDDHSLSVSALTEPRSTNYWLRRTIDPAGTDTPPLRSRVTANFATAWTGFSAWNSTWPWPRALTLTSPAATGLAPGGIIHNS